MGINSLSANGCDHCHSPGEFKGNLCEDCRDYKIKQWERNNPYPKGFEFTNAAADYERAHAEFIKSLG